ncbi:MAG: ParA family protein [Bacilli bacterium]|nr:ParA family protein [Bacilli bacterium]
MSKIIAIANQKGGVGKTTTAINLSAALSHFGRKTLLVDLDPQGNAGRGLGIPVHSQTNNIYSVLSKKLNIIQAIVSTEFDGLDIIPSNLSLAQFEAENRGGVDPFSVLKKALTGLPKGRYDYVILDCPPSLGLLTLNALSAADSVLIPVQCEYFAMEAVAAILSSVAKVQREWNSKLTIEGFLLTMYDPRTTLGTEIQSQVRKTFKENTFLTVIPRNQSVAESQGRQMPVTSFRPNSQGSSAYFGLAREVMDHEGR